MKKAFFLSLVLALSACSHDSSSGNNTPATPPTTVPHQLASHALKVKAPLSEQEKTEIKNYMATSENMPDMSLLLPTTNESEQQREQREQRTQNLNSTAKQAMNEIQNDCQVQTPAPTVVGSYEEPGQKQTSDSQSWITGTACPIAYHDNTHNEVLNIKSNIDDLKKRANQDPSILNQFDAVYNYVTQSTSEVSVTSVDMQKATDVVHQKMAVSSNTTLHVVGQTTNAYTIGHAQGVENLLDGQTAQMDLNFESLVNDTQTQAYFEINLTMGSVQPTVQIYVGADGKAAYYLNGQEVTENDLSDLFGQGFVPAMSTPSNNSNGEKE